MNANWNMHHPIKIANHKEDFILYEKSTEFKKVMWLQYYRLQIRSSIHTKLTKTVAAAINNLRGDRAGLLLISVNGQ